MALSASPTTLGSLRRAPATHDTPQTMPATPEPERTIDHSDHPRGQSHPARFSDRCGLCIQAKRDQADRSGASWPAVTSVGQIVRVGRQNPIMTNVRDPAMRAETLADPSNTYCGFCQRQLREGHRTDCPEFRKELLGAQIHESNTVEPTCPSCGFMGLNSHAGDCPAVLSRLGGITESDWETLPGQGPMFDEWWESRSRSGGGGLFG